MSREVVVVNGARTAIGTFGGSLKDIPPSDLAARVIREAVARAGVDPMAHYRVLYRRHEAPRLKAPFNLEARARAGFTDEELADLAAT